MSWSDGIKHFRKQEFRHDPDKVSLEAARRLDRARELAGRPIHVHVAWAPDGHAPKSAHYDNPCTAIDFHFSPGLTPLQELQILLAAGFTRVGHYPGWSPRAGWHADLRPEPLFWLCRNGAYAYFPTARTLAQTAGWTWIDGPAAAPEAEDLPRGIRNNNPLNIRDSKTVWNGEVIPDRDAAFETFESPEMGIRAGARILLTYLRRGHDTIREIITAWAPPMENDTETYIRIVSQGSEIDPDQRVTADDFPRIIPPMIQVENGVQPYPQAVIDQGCRLAREE